MTDVLTVLQQLKVLSSGAQDALHSQSLMLNLEKIYMSNTSDLILDMVYSACASISATPIVKPVAS